MSGNSSDSSRHNENQEPEKDKSYREELTKKYKVKRDTLENWLQHLSLTWNQDEKGFYLLTHILHQSSNT